MAKKPLFYILARKEVWILTGLGITIALFAFTLGVHLGKKVAAIRGESAQTAQHDPTHPTKGGTLETHEDSLPDRQELKEQEKTLTKNVQGELDQSLHTEVANTGIRVETPVPTELPKEKAETKTAAKTKMTTAEESEHFKPVEHAKSPEKNHELPVTTKAEKAQAHQASNKFTLQVGSHPERNLAQEQLESLQSLGMDPKLIEANVQGKTWFRVYLGKFETAREAKEFGAKAQKQHVIDSFLVSQQPDAAAESDRKE